MTSTKQKFTNQLDTLSTKNYSADIVALKDIFPEWSEMDLMAVLEEAMGDVALAVSRITEGQAAQWDEVKTAKRKEKPKKFEPPVRGTRGTRGGRGRGRGGRGGYTGDRNPHGGEKSAANTISNTAVDDSWENPISDQATLANTDDWGLTAAVVATEQEWAEIDTVGDKIAEKLTLSEEPKKTKKPKENVAPPNPPRKQKSSNWAQVVKGPESTPAPESASPKKKKEKTPKEEAALEVVEPKELPLPVKTVESPSIKEATKPVKSFSQFSPSTVETEKANTVQTSQLPPGLSQKRTVPNQKKTNTPAAPLTNGGVQFGSFSASTPMENEPKTTTPDRTEENPKSAFASQPIQRADAAVGAPGLHASYQNAHSAINDTNYYSDQRSMGYYAHDTPFYGSNKGDSHSNSHSNSPNVAINNDLNGHQPQPNFAYPYYPPYYMPNQFQQSPYQPMYAQPYGKSTYGGFTPTAATQSTTGAVGATKPAASVSAVPGLTAGLQTNTNSFPYGFQAGQFYPTNMSYDEHDYSKNYGQPYTSFGQSGLNSKTSEFKGQNRNRQGYEKNANTTNVPTVQQSPPPGAYYGNQQFQGMHYQPLMMHQFPQGPQQQSGYQNQRGGHQQGYWNGN